MTAKEKAESLVTKFYDEFSLKMDYHADKFDSSKNCALIACDEIINSTDDNENYKLYASDTSDFSNYWMKVKKEIEKL